jgi:antirestriction protein ArdC
MNKPTASAPRDLYQEATDRIIKALEAGTTPWQKPWESVDTGPLRNGASGNSYHGINTLMLYCSSLERGFTDPRWLSFKQCQQNGWKIKKGAKSERVYFYKPLEVDERDFTGVPVIDAATGLPRKKQIPFLQASPVFNAQEIEGIPSLAPGTMKFSPIEAGEAILQRCPVEIRYGGNSAHYNPTADTIGMPERSQWKSSEAFYATLAHEMIHSIGHKDRCNREFGQRFGDSSYAMEELVAEMGSVQLGMETGLPSQIDNHASYVDHWLKVLKADKKALFVAAAKASQAVDFVMGRPQLTAESRQNFNIKEAARQVVRDVVKSAPLTPPILSAADSASVPAVLEVVAKLRARRAKQKVDDVSPEVVPPRQPGMEM